MKKKHGQGRLKIYLGMISGVGKSYSMLKAALNLKNAGTSVMIGFLDSLNRSDIEKLGDQFDRIAPLQIGTGGNYSLELDIDAIISASPDLVLIDDLSHINAPKQRHQKRYQDVLEILNNGIDVYTTLNVQNIESCAEIVEEIIGIQVKETLPDSILDAANEIVLIDATPDEILNRLREGKIFSLKEITEEQKRFFTRGHILALRETVLRVLSDKVNNELRDLKIEHGIPQIWKTNFRILVPLLPSREGEYLIRMARRISAGLSAQWMLCNIDYQKQHSVEGETFLKKNSHLAKQLGAEVISVTDESFTKGMARIVREYQITHIVLLKNKSALQGRLQFFVKTFPEVDILLLSPGFAPKARTFSQGVGAFSKNTLWSTKNFIISCLYLAGITALCLFFVPKTDYQIPAMIYILFLAINSLNSKTLVIIITTLLAGLAWNFFFIGTMLIFELNTLSRIITLFAFLSVALVTGLLTSRLTRKERILKDADSRLEFMLFFNKVLFQSKGLTEMLDLALKKLKASFNADFGFILSQREQDKALKKELEEFVIGGLLLNKKEFQAATWAFENLRPCGRFTQTYSDVKGTYLPLAYADNCYGVLCLISKEREISSIELTLLEDVSRYCALALMQSSFDIK